MPITQSAKKALRQNIKRRYHNSKKKSALKSIIKEFNKLIISKKTEEAKKFLSEVYQKLDKAAKANLIKKNKASRLKSRLAKKLAKK